jgi:uncharacterized protein (DUF1800 family)
METNRRRLLQGASLLAFAGWAGLPPAFATESGNSPENDLKTVLGRLSFGATPESLAELKGLGVEAWLDRQLGMAGDDEGTRERFAKAYIPMEYADGKDENGHSWKGTKEPRQPLRYLDARPADVVGLNNWDQGMDYAERERPAREVQLAALIRAVHREGQLHELMTQFWHDHFSVNAFKGSGEACYFPLYDRAIRTEALGNFRKLLGENARSASMLFYLNNEGSRASPANENYARELLELHTLGEMHYVNDKYGNWDEVPGAKDGLASGYIDQDVYETARAFTGWTIADGRDIGEGEKAPDTGEFHYVQAWHDPYQKRILGHEFKANAAPLSDGETVLDMLAGHPGTAKFLATKLCRRLLADEPDADLVRQTADLFGSLKDDPAQIAKTVRFIVLSKPFRELPASKVKRPFEFLVSLYRATGANVVTSGNAFNVLSKAGWKQHEWRPPTGHPDIARHWANTNTVSVTTQIAINAHEEWFADVDVDFFAGDATRIKTLADLGQHWSRRLLCAEPQPEFVKALVEPFGTPEDMISSDEGERDWQARTVIALIALTPEFMMR